MFESLMKETVFIQNERIFQSERFATEKGTSEDLESIIRTVPLLNAQLQRTC